MNSARPVIRLGRSSWSALQARRRREHLAFAIAVSLYLHSLLLLLHFGAPGFGLPGLAWPWAERRVQASGELTARVVQPPRAPPAAAPPLVVTMQTPPAPKPALKLRADSSLRLKPKRASARRPETPRSVPQRAARTKAPAAKARAPKPKVQPEPRPAVVAQSEPIDETFNVPAPEVTEPAPSRAPLTFAEEQIEEPSFVAQEPEDIARREAAELARLKAEEEARRRAEEEARKLAEEEARKRARALAEALEQKKREEARREAEALEARRLAEERARRETEERERALALQKEEEARKLEEARAAEEARRLALEAEALRRLEAAARRQAEEAARAKELAERKRLEEEAAARARETAERKRAEDEAAAHRARERLAAEKPGAPAPGPLSGKELAAKALDQLRRPGAARDDLLRPPSRPARLDHQRRRSIFGNERDVVLRMYVESWRVKLERNGALNFRPSAAWSAHEPPVVTVSIRSDGSLENVLIHRSSGVRELDDAVRRIAHLYAPYSPFPPDLARQYDVIDIRRVWFFDGTLRILD